MQNSPPTEYFPGINFNFSFYTSGKDFVTKEYVDNNFLKAVGYAYSRAISTSFNGIIYAFGGIETTFIKASGDISANTFTGSGAGLTSLNASNISGGTLGVDVGGTGQNVLPFNRILVGNGNDPIITSANLTYESNILSAPKFAGSGSELTNLNASCVTDGTLEVARGGTGANNFTADRLLFGNGINPITNSGNLTWLSTSNILSVSGDINITGTYKKNNNAIVSSQWVTSGTTIEYNGGSVGIGTSAFDYKLNVNGTTQTTKLTTTNLGIGITNPTIPLHIYNSSNSRILLDTTTTGTASIEFRRGTGFDIQQDFRFINDTDSTLKLQYENNQQAYADSVAQLMWVLPNVTSGLLSVKMWKNTEFVGNVGIGTLPSTTATTKLNITGDAEINGNIGVGKTPNSTYKIDVNGSINATSILINGTNITGSKWTTGTPSTNIYYNSGNVGIGNTNPGTYKLNVTGSINASADISSNTLYATTNITSQANAFINNVLGFSTLYNGSGANFACNKIDLWGYPSSRQYGFGISGGTLDYFTNSNHRWYTGTVAGGVNSGFGNQRMTLDVNGNLNVGSINTGYVVGTSYILSYDACYARSSYDTKIASNSGGMYLEMGDIGNNNYLRLGAFGGVTAINSGAARPIFFRCNGYTWQFQNNGLSHNAYNNTVWNIESDQRIKENIKKANLKTCFNNVKNINLYRFNYIDGFKEATKYDKNQLGFIAQQVQQHFPKSVLRRKSRIEDKREVPDLSSVNIDQINFTLFGAVKQLIKVVEKQSRRIKKLEEMLGIIDDDIVDDDADESYIKIECDEVDINTIEPSEPEGV